MKLKQKPEDFLVEELYAAKPSGSGEFVWFRLKKRNLDTLGALKLLGLEWRVPLKAFGYAGLKDRRAVTVQVCSVRGVRREIVEVYEQGLETTFVGLSDIPVTLGSHQGNKFTITVRDIEQAPALRHRFVNYFGEQRFSANNADIGRAIIRNDYPTAVKLALAGDHAEADAIRQHLEHAPSDYLGALKLLPLKLLRLFVHAYQSKLWNDAVRRHTQLGNLPPELPVVGFGTGHVDQLTQELLKTEGITPRHFILRSFPELSEEGTLRKTWIDVPSLTIGPLENDELNAGRKKVVVQFSLPSGAYATEVVQQLFSQGPA